jgi:hypothetical protein
VLTEKLLLMAAERPAGGVIALDRSLFGLPFEQGSQLGQ